MVTPHLSISKKQSFQHGTEQLLQTQHVTANIMNIVNVINIVGGMKWIKSTEL